MNKSSDSAGTSMFIKRYARPKTIGLRPGTVHVSEDALPATIRVTSYGPDKLIDQADCDLETTHKLRGAYPVTWIDIVGLESAEFVQQVGDLFGLHRLALEDAVNTTGRSKVEHYEDHLFVVLQLPQIDEKHTVEQVSLFVGSDFVLSWRKQPSSCFDGVRERVQSTGRVLRQSGADYLLYALVDVVIDAYFPVMEQIGDRLDRLDEAMEQSIGPELVSHVHGVRHDVRLLRRVIWPLREVVDHLARDHEWLLKQETQVHLRDCHDHAIQLLDTLESYREVCSDLRDLYSTAISNRMNEVMKVLTIIATIFIPLSFIAGVYGMNFDPEVSSANMPELRWPWGYPFALGLMALVAIGQLLFFRWRGWLGTPTKKRTPGANG